MPFYDLLEACRSGCLVALIVHAPPSIPFLNMFHFCGCLFGIEFPTVYTSAILICELLKQQAIKIETFIVHSSALKCNNAKKLPV